MPKNTSKTGKSSKTARVLSLLTDPAASLLGGSRGHRDEDDETEPLDGGSPQARGLDDAATESRIQASLAAEEDSLVTELFGKKESTRPAPAPAQSAAAAPAPAPPPRNEPEAQEPDPRTLELLSMLSNPSTLGNSAMPLPEEGPPAALGMDFADELTAGMPEQPRYEPEPEPEPAPQQPTLQYAEPPARQQAAPQYAAQPAQQQPTLQYAAQPVQQQAAPQYAPQPAQQRAAPQYAAQSVQQQPTLQYAAQPAQQQPTLQYAAQPAQQQAAPQYAAQSVQQAAPRQKASPAAHAVKEKQEEFVCFNLTQALVEDKAEKLMKQFGMCTCNRCKVDVTAIALSNLPAKYVAMQNRDILPLLSMYEEKYSAAVTVQVMNACRLVMKRPHHGR